MKERQIPYSREAETYVLGSILISPELAVEFCGSLTQNDFYVEKNKKIYQAVETLYIQKKEVNVLNVIETLKSNGTFEDIGSDYLNELVDAVPTIVTTGTYVDVLKDKSLERELYYEAIDITRRIIDGEEELGELLAGTEQNILRIVNKQRTGELKKVGTAVDAVFEIIETNRQKGTENLIGLDTGYDFLNQYTYGFQPGELIILAARPGIGKSALALNISYKLCRNHPEKHVAFFSLEMGIDQLIMRLLSISSNVELGKIRSGDLSGDDTSKILNSRIELDDMNFYIDETTTNNMEDIKIKCRKLARENKLDFIVIDYLQLLSTGRQKISRYEEVSSLSRSLKLLARELNIPILALSQLSRAVEARQNSKEGKVVNEPILSDLRESGSIEQDADIVLFLHRENAVEGEQRRPLNAKIKCIIAKNRQGMTGSCDLIFRGNYSSFENASIKKNSNEE